MVVALEIVFVIVCVVLGLWWVSRTSRWSHMKSERARDREDPGRGKHDLDRSRRELSRKHFRDDDAGPQYGGGQNYSGGAGM